MGKGGPLAFLNKVGRRRPAWQLPVAAAACCRRRRRSPRPALSLPPPQKTWHPGRVQNLEEVWKREQDAAKEEQKLKEYAKQLQEERAREELAQVAEAAGHKM